MSATRGLTTSMSTELEYRESRVVTGSSWTASEIELLIKHGECECGFHNATLKELAEITKTKTVADFAAKLFERCTERKASILL